jgi:DNA-binding Lrp family transcriptional regulator
MGDNWPESDPGDTLPPGRSARRLDDIDRRILDVLTRDARVSVRTLAERVHVSRSNAHARLDRLIGDGVITGFRAEIDPRKAGLDTSAHVALSIEQHSWRTVAAALRQVPYVVHIALLSGDHDALLLVRAPDNATLRHVVLDRVQRIEGVRHTRTWLCFEEFDANGAHWT